MTAKAWRKKIIEQMTAKSVPHAGFENVIETLADILEERDAVYTQYKDEGGHVLVEKVSDRGASNMIINPLLKAWQEMNRDALTYWRELGLTPQGLKKLNDQAVAQETAPDLGALLMEIAKE